MALPAIGALGLLILLSFVVLYAMQNTVSQWLAPVLAWIFKDRHAWWGKVLLYPLQKITHGLILQLNMVRGILGHSVAVVAAPVGKALHGGAWLVQEWAFGFEAFAQATYNAFSHLRHVTFPNLIEKALNPIRERANDAYKLAQAATEDLRIGANGIADALNGVGWSTSLDPGRALSNLGHAFENLWHYTRTTIDGRIDAIEGVVIPGLRERIAGDEAALGWVIDAALPGLSQRVKGLEDALVDLFKKLGSLTGDIPTVAAIAAVAVAAVETFAPDLFCRNTRGFTNKLCAFDPSLLDEILAFALTAEAIANLPELVKIMQSVTRETAEGIQELAGVG